MARNKKVYASYKPLHETLKKHNLSMYDLIKLDLIQETTTTRMAAGFVMPRVIATLCDYFKCSEEEIVEYIPIPEEQ